MGNGTKPNLRPYSRRAPHEMGVCQDCQVLLNDDNWSPSMRGETGLRPRHICRKCWCARQRRYASQKPREQRNAEQRARRRRRVASWSEQRKRKERRRNYNGWLKRQYGITIEDYDALYKKQKGKCAICRSREPKGKGGFHVDHCHQTGVVRGLLCTHCNMFLGLVKDDVAVLRRAIRYVKKAGQKDG